MPDFDYSAHCENALNTLKCAGNYRVFTDIARKAGNFPMAYDATRDKEITIWCNNDYLGMGQHDIVTRAVIETTKSLGAGAGGTRNIAGTHHPIVELESLISTLHGKERSLVFTSGYVANATALSTLGKIFPDAVIFSDANNHASMIEGIRYSGCEKHIFRHNDMEHLEALLQATDISRPKLIAFESVYSMDGDVAPIHAICDLAEKYNALTYIDEVHACGLYGEKGTGKAEELGALERLDIIQGTFAKAYGVIGGYITGKESIIDVVRSFGAGFIFSTSMTPANAEACRASMDYVANHNELRAQFSRNVDYVKDRLTRANIAIHPQTQTHIIPVIIGDPVACKRTSDLLMERHNIFVQHINYPTVPKGTERLRITPTPLHTEAMVDDLINALQDVLGELGIKQAA